MLISMKFVIIKNVNSIDRFFMNLHEECLLKYLKSPDGISMTTEILKLNNMILEQRFIIKNFVAKFPQFRYTKIQ